MKNLFIEIADTFHKREVGLMKRKHMSQNQGMLFKFPQETFPSFWMKDTYIPLDIAFIDDKGKILQIESMSPLSTKPVYANSRCKYALEVNRGWFKENGVQVGSIIGGDGIGKRQKTAQLTPQLTQPPIESVLPTTESPMGQPQPPRPAPDVTLNLSYKERLERANLKGQNMILIYQTKGGITLPPKVISPPYEFEQDADGHHDAIVNAWDNQTGGWKSFLIDNILSLEDKK